MGKRQAISGHRRQRGLALILMTIILVLGTTYVVVDQMNSVSQRLGQDKTTSDALALAKDALIGHSANNANRPGALLCPDTNNDGYAEGTCAGANQRVGRLPWKTLGLPDLRDASGERLWYALSDAFRDTGVVNSNTAGQITLRDDITGAIAASTVVALVIAPGATGFGQDRSGPLDSSANKLNVANYLEGKNNTTQDAGATNDDVFVQPRPTAAHPRGECLIAAVASECNDRVLVITHNDLFSVVENMVAKRIETEIAPLLTTYRTVFGAYPFPRTFADADAAASTTWVGTAANTYGQLPLTTGKSIFTWITSGGGAPSMTYSGSFWLWSGPTCSATAAQVTCTIRYSCGAPTVTLTAHVAGIGLGFSMFTDPYTAVDGKLNWNHFLYNSSTHLLTGTGIAGSAGHSVTIGALNTDGSETMTYTAPLANQGSCVTPVTRTLRLNSIAQMAFIGEPGLSPFIAALTKTGYSTDWYVRNEWYKLTLYALAAGYAPGGSASCSSPNCLTVNNLTAPNNNKGVILVLAGRAIGLEDRSTSGARALVTNYFESQNSTPADRVYEQTPRSTTFNDKVVVVAP